jgi:hypothetical protein
MSTTDLLSYPEGIYNWIFLVCFIHPIHILCALYYKFYLCCFIDILLFITSLNHWKYPLLNSTKRYVDIYTSIIAISYHYYLSIINYILISIILMSIGILLYPLNTYLYNHNYVKFSAVCHCLLHIVISLGACFIYIYLE